MKDLTGVTLLRTDTTLDPSQVWEPPGVMEETKEVGDLKFRSEFEMAGSETLVVRE